MAKSKYLKKILFTELAPLGRFSHRVAISVCRSVRLSVCLSVYAIVCSFSEASHFFAQSLPKLGKKLRKHCVHACTFFHLCVLAVKSEGLHPSLVFNIEQNGQGQRSLQQFKLFFTIHIYYQLLQDINHCLANKIKDPTFSWLFLVQWKLKYFLFII